MSAKVALPVTANYSILQQRDGELHVKLQMWLCCGCCAKLFTAVCTLCRLDYYGDVFLVSAF